MARQSGQSRRVPSGPALEHLAKLAESVGLGQVALAADAPRSSLSRLLVQRRPTMSRALAEKILAVQGVDRSTMSMVDSIGAQRRLQALYALGHWRMTIVEASGLTPQSISELLRGTWVRISVGCDDAVRRAYAQLSMSVDNCECNLVRARREQWAPPLAWDEETIDDPMALPALDAVPPAPAGKDAATRFLLGESVVLCQAARREVIGYLMEWSPKSPEEIGAQLEMTPDAVSRVWERMKARARETGVRVPTRRLALAGV
ncbi:hypothetical protein ACIOEZ_31855 [Streptomyces sp. NPDC087866]|uniref:hypothetical protein n=1 Tax=Streptomyces sp. NPDC087866 TaxID=3365815 RepID=UPI0037F99095